MHPLSELEGQVEKTPPSAPLRRQKDPISGTGSRLPVRIAGGDLQYPEPFAKFGIGHNIGVAKVMFCW